MVTAGPSRELPVTWQLSGHARRLVTLAIAALVIAALTRRPEFAGLAAPALALLLPGRGERPDVVGIQFATGLEQLTEGEESAVLVRVTGYGSGQVQLRLSPGAWIIPGPARLGRALIETMEA